jgi:hypothetical protein
MIEPTSPVNSPWLWALGFGASLLLLAGAAICSARRSNQSGRPLLKWVLAMVFVLAAVLATSGLDKFAPALSQDALTVLRAITLFGGVALACWITLPTVVAQTDSAVRISTWSLVMGAWLLALSSGRLRDQLAVQPENEAQLTSGNVAPEDLVSANDARLETDRGRPIAAFRPADSLEKSIATWARTRPDRRRGFTDSTIEQAPPDPTSNCYGWVFADGRYVIAAIDADRILSDNGYRRVDRPRVDDVVAYRSTVTHELIHVGIVRVADEDLVLVESKWGFGGRFLHQPQGQPFCKDFDYYRSPRRGHKLRENNRSSHPLSAPAEETKKVTSRHLRILPSAEGK